MRKIVALVFNYSVDGLLADENTDFWKFCFGLPDDPVGLQYTIDVFRNADVQIMGRTAYEGMAKSMPANSGHPFASMLNPAPKVVFSRTLKRAEWSNTTIASGDTAEEIDKLRQGGDGHMVVWGGVRLWRSLIALDLIDEFHIDMYSYISGEGTRLFDGAPKSYQLDLIASTRFSSGLVTLHYRRHR